MKLKFDNKLIAQPVKVNNSETDPFIKEYLSQEEQRILTTVGDLLKNPEQYGFSPEEVADYQDDPFGFFEDFGYAMGADLDTKEGNVRQFREFVKQKAHNPNHADAFDDDYVSDAIYNFHQDLFKKSRKK
jgi:hypothetical protein